MSNTQHIIKKYWIQFKKNDHRYYSENETEEFKDSICRGILVTFNISLLLPVFFFLNYWYYHVVDKRLDICSDLWLKNELQNWKAQLLQGLEGSSEPVKLQEEMKS